MGSEAKECRLGLQRGEYARGHRKDACTSLVRKGEAKSKQSGRSEEIKRGCRERERERAQKRAEQLKMERKVSKEDGRGKAALRTARSWLIATRT